MAAEQMRHKPLFQHIHSEPIYGYVFEADGVAERAFDYDEYGVVLDKIRTTAVALTDSVEMVTRQN